MDSSTEVLKRAHALLGEYGVSRGVMARDENGGGVFPRDPKATEFCSLGAVARACQELLTPDVFSDDEYREVLEDASSRLKRVMGDVSIAIYNDTHTDQQVRKAFLRAIGPHVSPHAPKVRAGFSDGPLVAA